MLTINECDLEKKDEWSARDIERMEDEVQLFGKELEHLKSSPVSFVNVFLIL